MKKTNPKKSWCTECKNYNHPDCKKRNPNSRNKKCGCWCNNKSSKYMIHFSKGMKSTAYTQAAGFTSIIRCKK